MTRRVGGPPARGGRERISQEMLAALAGRLTVRDWWLLEMLTEHQILTRDQITRAAFTGERQTRYRLADLYRMQAVDRIRPQYGMQASPYHYGLGLAGARLLAGRRGLSVAALGYRPDHLPTLAGSPRLGHLVGTNGLFTALIHASRSLPAGVGLTVWWSERRATAAWAGAVRPDGYGIWHGSAGKRMDFFCEYDTGTEGLSQVLRKLPAYLRLAATSGITSPLLIWLPAARRETHLRRRLTATPGHAAVPVVTASPLTTPAGSRCGGPAGAVWLPLSGGQRLTIDELAGRLGTASPPGSPQPTGDAAPYPQPPVLRHGIPGTHL